VADDGREIGGRGKLTDVISLGVLSSYIHRDHVDDVLLATGKLEKRTRSLPAHVVVYFVIAMAIFGRDGYEEVLRKLVNGLRFLRNWESRWSMPTTGAISQARDRLGVEPMKQLFELLAEPVARPGTLGAWLRGRRLMAIDGVQLDLPATAENLAEFGNADDATQRPFPQLRSVGLGECGTHAIVAATLGSIYDGERELAKGLIGAVADDMVVMADRGFYSFDLWKHFMVTGADLVWRVPATLKLPVLELLPDGSYRSEINSTTTRRTAYAIPLSAVDDPRDATQIPVRVVEYTIINTTEQSDTFRLITTILEPDQAHATEIAFAYHQRWEYEIALKEIETQLLEPGQGLRSKKPDLVRQEFWGLLLAHHAIRSLITDAADTADIDPDRISFLRTLNIVRRQVMNRAAAFSPRNP
jgi:hypothetical protein